MIERIRKVALAFPCVILLSFLFVACGDDASSASKDDPAVTAKKFASLEELPACTGDIDGMLADVSGEYYACILGGWNLVDRLVAGVCNIPACDEDAEGENVFVASDRKVYRCASNTWKGLDGNSFSEDDFIGCFVQSVIQDSVVSADFLKNCNTSREGALSVVGKDLVSCASQEWVDILDKVISEGDLPKCVENGKYVYVLSKLTAYECKDGVWYKGGEPLSSSSTPVSSSSSGDTPKTSSADDKKSSSSGKTGSSSSATSSSTPVSSVAIPEDDGTKVRGVCMASVKESIKGDEVTYTFYNLGGTPLTFNWMFDDGSTPEKSGRVSPVVKYSKGGVHYAKLVVNEGAKSASDTIVCTGVKVNGVPVTGCECAPEQDAMMVVGDAEIMPVEWKVKGCSGAGPFRYEWGDTPIKRDSFVTWLPPGLGSFAPTLTVYNDDGETMEPQCKPVAVTGLVAFNCSANATQFTMTYESGANSSLASMPVTLVSSDGLSLDTTILPSSSYMTHNYNDGKDYMRYSWVKRTTGASLSIPDSSSPLASYSVIYAGDTLCRASRVTCGPTAESQSILQDSAGSWSVFVDGQPYSASSYAWNISDGEIRFETTAQNPKHIYTTPGAATAVVTLNKGLKDETTVSCSNLNVLPNIKGCTCDGPVYRTSNNDISELSSVVAEWEVNGCDGAGETLTNTWSFDRNGRSIYLSSYDTIAKLYFNQVGVASPTVTVSNQYGVKRQVACADAEAIYISCGPSENESTIGESVTWSIDVDGNLEPSTYQWTFYDNDENEMEDLASTDATPVTTLTKPYYMSASVVLNKGLENEYEVSCSNLYVQRRPVTGCTCGVPELVSESHNIAIGDGAKYRWHVTGCDAHGATPLIYSWINPVKPLESDSSYGEYTYTQFNDPSAHLYVTNADGAYISLTCGNAPVQEIRCYPDRDTAELGQTVSWFSTYRTIQDGYIDVISSRWTFVDADGEFDSDGTSYTSVVRTRALGNMTASVLMNEGLPTETSVTCSPLYVKPNSITSCACDYDVITGPDGSFVTWTVSGCQTVELMPLTYEWSDIVTPRSDYPAEASASFTESGTYRPTVKVTSALGTELVTICPAINVGLGEDD